MSPTGRGATRPSPLAPEDEDDAAWLAQRMALDAGVQTARLRRQASAQTATICAAAEREAEIVWQQAAVRAATVRAAAEREAAQLRATVIRLSAGPAPVRGAADPGVGPARRPPRSSPGSSPRSSPRQLVAVRVAAAATAALLLFAVAAGATEVVLHGFAFFVFRSAGTGETPGSGIQEDQGPGQPGSHAAVIVHNGQ